jgi:solute carrier family 34 (sodium-dependent phosphate cotransporter)
MTPENSRIKKVKGYFLMLLALFLFIFAIDSLTAAMSQLNNSLAIEVLQATKNPFISLFIGLLLTALLQSSSTVTASVVAVVASGTISLEQGVPMVMGANIGTTLTSTLVSFSYIMKKGRFRKALSSGISHDFFNILTVIILLPLELHFKFISRLAGHMANFLAPENSNNGPMVDPHLLTKPLSEWIIEVIQFPFLAIILSILLVFLAIKLLSQSVFQVLDLGKSDDLNKYIFKNPGVSFLYGTFFTAAVQSSSVTTSLIVPLVAEGRVNVKKVFPFIIGANIGTTITAAIASIYKTEAAIALALAHFIFNVIGAIIFLPFPVIRNLPVLLAIYMGKKSSKNRIVGFAYILLTFFIIPFFLIYFSKD